MFGQVVFRSFLWFVFLCAVLTIGIIGCDDDDDRIGISADNDNWLGTWEVESIAGEILKRSLPAGGEALGIDLFITANDWIFDAAGTMDWELGIKFEAKEGGLGLLWEGSLKIIGTYRVSGSNYTLRITQLEGTGGIFEVFGKTDELSRIFLSMEDGEIGTWSRKGNTLALNSDDGTAIVLKKK